MIKQISDLCNVFKDKIQKKSMQAYKLSSMFLSPR